MKRVNFLVLFLLISGLWSCDDQLDVQEQRANNNEIKIVAEDIENKRYTFIEGDEAVNILSADDDYTIKLSTFDYASKFKSEVPLDVEGRKTILKTHVLSWTADQKAIVDKHMDDLVMRLDSMNIDMPEIQFILTDSSDEGGAAYTRGQSIVLKPNMITTSEGTKRLIAHEMFHVYSRAHKELREAIYGVIHYERCEELIIPEELKALTIANPDAPDNNYFITGKYKGVELSFIPIIYSTSSYDLEKGGSFFSTLKDDMLAVEIVDGIPQPLYNLGQVLIVKKEEIENYYELIGTNTEYTYHPEETMADNFVLLLFEEKVPSQWVVDGLKNIISHE
ncbi:MAG: DUF4157 domain-containing protein [Clostridia bacterium]|nr:DUF4157 domain-containing protein [Clostridia bacterium]